jgi:aminoglycoside phosphotransferase (APT) family kinase protein
VYAHDEVDVTGEVARSLITQQFPEFVKRDITFLDRGMDNAVFLAGDIVFRFPVRRLASQILETEIAVMPCIASHVDVTISAPCYAGTASGTYPFTFAGFPFVTGSAVSEFALTHEQRAALARPLAQFLRSLHALDVNALGIARVLPRDTIGRLDHRRRYPLVAARLEHLGAHIDANDADTLMRYLERTAPEDREGARCIVHGDLYARHILVDDNGNLSGVIDWGDVHFGNPAIDLAAAFYVLPPAHIREFYAWYGLADERTQQLALYRALYHGVLVADLGMQWERPDVRDCGLRAIQTALAFLRGSNGDS